MAHVLASKVKSLRVRTVRVPVQPPHRTASGTVAESPLVRLLGYVDKSIPAYGAVGYDGVAESAKVAEDWAKRGFKGIKAKIGYPTVQDDVAVIRAMRKAVGDEIAIMVDFNQCLTPVEA